MKKVKGIVCLVMILSILLSSTVYGTSTLESVKNSETNYVLLAQNQLDIICNEISSNHLGGIYFEDETTMVVNLIESEFNQLSSSIENKNGIKVIYKPVEFSLAELENVKDQLEPFMVEFNIATLDANDVTNKIDIQLYEENSEIYSLVSQFIDLEYVNISILPKEYKLEFTIATSPPETGNYYSLQNIDTRGTKGKIYPGYIIKIGSDSVYCTAGPRYTSLSFYTCGHAPYEYFNRTQTVYFNHYSGLVSIVQTSNVILGTQGDRCLVNVSGGEYTLPSTNSFATGSGTYTYGTGTVGTAVEMHGGYSGISRGSIVAVNQSVSVDGITVGNLTKASYTCKNGDSGAAVFSNNITNSSGKCYGIQSIGANPNSSGVYQESYFHAF